MYSTVPYSAVHFSIQICTVLYSPGARISTMPLSAEETARLRTQNQNGGGEHDAESSANNLLQMVIEIPFPIQSPNPNALYGGGSARGRTTGAQEERLMALRQQLEASTSTNGKSAAEVASGGGATDATGADADAESARRPQIIRLSTVVQQCEASLVQTSWPLQNERCPMVIDRGLFGMNGGGSLGGGSSLGHGSLSSHSRSIAVNSETFLRLFGYSLEQLADVLDIDLAELRRREFARLDEMLQVNLFNFRY